MSDFKFIAGLGNPGSEYEHTRHNVGFSLLEEILSRSRGASGWRKKDGAAIAEVEFAGDKVLLIRPLEFMNVSGESVGRVLRFLKGTPEQLIIVHDDLDLPFGMVRVKPDGSDGGQKGVRSIIQVLGTPNIVRVKMGIGRPTRPGADISGWVLDRFSKDEARGMPEYFDRAIAALECLRKEGVKVAQQKFNERIKPAKPEEKV